MYGALYRITEKQLAELDRTEDVPRDYERVALTVHRVAISALNQNLPEAKAWAYVGQPPRLTTEVNPDPEYVQLIVQASLERGFPQDYIENYLLKVPVLQGQ